MQISSLYEKGSRDTNEDVLLITNDTFGVFDGAKSLNKYISSQGETSGMLAAKIAKTIFSKNNKPLLRSAIDANEHIKKTMVDAGIDIKDKLNLWGTTAAVIKIKEKSFDWLVVSDSTILIIKEDKSFQEVSSYEDHDREILVKWKQYASQRRKNIRELVAEDLVKIRQKSNEEYGILNGESNAKRFIRTGEVPIAGVKHILLCTDGLLLPNEDPTQEKDFSRIIELYLHGGLKEVKKTVRYIEKTDPNCWKYPRYKQHDDIAAIAIRF